MNTASVYPVRRRRRGLSLASALAVASCFVGCSESDFVRPVLITNAADVTLCCDPAMVQAGPAVVGDFQIQIFEGQLRHLRPDTIAATFTAVVDDESGAPPGNHSIPPPVRLSLDSGSPLALGSTSVDVLVEDCYFSRVRVRFFVEVVGRRADDFSFEVHELRGSFAVVNTCPPAGPPPSPPQRIVEAIVGAPVDGFAQFVVAAPTGVPTRNASSQIPLQVPDLGYTETFEVGALAVQLDQQQLDDAFLGPNALFPLGPGERGVTFFADSPAAMVPGVYMLAWQCVVDDIPLAQPVKQIQLAMVLDRDRESTNNFVAQPPADTDPFDDTDTFFTANYDPFALAWRFAATDAQGTPQLPLTTGARMILSGQVQFFVIPVADLGDPTSVYARFTTFAHEGDFGFSGGPWSADQTRPIDEDRLEFSTRPAF